MKKSPWQKTEENGWVKYWNPKTLSMIRYRPPNEVSGYWYIDTNKYLHGNNIGGDYITKKEVMDIVKDFLKAWE